MAELETKEIKVSKLREAHQEVVKLNKIKSIHGKVNSVIYNAAVLSAATTLTSVFGNMVNGMTNASSDKFLLNPSEENRKSVEAKIRHSEKLSKVSYISSFVTLGLGVTNVVSEMIGRVVEHKHENKVKEVNSIIDEIGEDELTKKYQSQWMNDNPFVDELYTKVNETN